MIDKTFILIIDNKYYYDLGVFTDEKMNTDMTKLDKNLTNKDLLL